MVTYFQSSISCVNLWMYLTSLTNVLKNVRTIDLSSESSSVDDSPIEAKIDSYSSSLCSFYNKPPSSNRAKVILLPIFSWDDAVYRIYNTAGCMTSSSEDGRDVYANTIMIFSVKIIVMWIKYFLCIRYIHYVPFLRCGIPTNMTRKQFVIDEVCLTPLCQHV